MRTSVLSPRIIARILRNEPILYKGCLHRRIDPNRSHIIRPVSIRGSQRRTLFGWISPVPKEAYLATGEKASLNYLKEACARLDNQVRPPPAEDVAKAWVIFVRDRDARGGTYSDAEASYVGRILELLQTTEAERLPELLPDDSLWQALRSNALKHVKDSSEEAGKAYVMLSQLLFKEILARSKAEGAPALSEDQQNALWNMHITTMIRFRRSKQARDLIVNSELQGPLAEAVWSTFLKALAQAGVPPNQADALPAIIQKHVGRLAPELRPALSLVYAVAGRMAMAKEYAVIEPTTEGAFDIEYITSLLSACRRHKDLDWGREIIKTITSNAQAMRTQKPLWNIMFEWALATGKSVDEIHKIMQVMVKTDPDFYPTTSDINRLITIANERADPYLAERLIALGAKWGCRPDEETSLLQMDYRLSVGDIEGARTAFDLVRSFRDSTREDAGPRINALIQAMCARKTYSFDTIMETVDVLGERGARFSADTVASLAVLHLGRDEYNDVADLLSTNTKDFSLAERATVRKAILALMLKGEEDVPLQRLWDTYMIYQHVFTDAPRVSRIQIMQEFFKRKRPDMAIHVFNHMRRHASPAVNPDTETYIAALIGCGETRDDESLAVVNNVLKLDIHVDETTKLHNARMIAFFGTGESEKAQGVWDDIVRSEEGPSRQSLVCVFRVCEQSDFGEMRARGVWDMVRKIDIVLDSEIVAAYVGALSGNGCEDDATRVVEQCASGELGVEVDELILAKLFNGCLTKARQEEMEIWIEQRYPELWAKVKMKGFTTRYNATRVFPLDVKMVP